MAQLGQIVAASALGKSVCLWLFTQSSLSIRSPKADSTYISVRRGRFAASRAKALEIAAKNYYNYMILNAF